MFSEFAIKEQVTIQDPTLGKVTSILGNNGRCFISNIRSGAWVTGNEALHKKISSMELRELFEHYPLLEKGIVERKWHRQKEFKSINPWTLKVADHCNMGCTYCYENAMPKSRRMTTETASKVIDEMLLLGQDYYEVLFHGGEPTLNMEVIRFFVHTFRAKMPSSTKASFHTHSNLYHFPDALRDELRALGVTVGTSLDGRAQIHDSQRVQVNKRGGTYEKILSNLKRTTVENTILTVTKNNQGHLFDAAKHFVEDLKFTKFHFLPMMPHGREQIAALLPDINVMTEEVLKVCDYVIDHHRRGNKIAFRNLSDVLVALHGGTYTDACLKCVLNEYKIQNITISHDGRFGPCDVTADMPEYSLGNIHACQGDLREKMQSPKNFRFFKNLDSIPGCSTCAFKYSCAGGCEEESKRPGYERTIYCDFYYTLFAAVACNLEELNALGYGAEFIGDDPYVQKSPALSEHEQRCN